MSMIDAFFNKGFKGPKCKTLLKLTIPRIKLLRNRREIQLKQMRRDIANLLENGQEATARIRVEHIIREENMMAAQEIIELFCELISVRIPMIETQRECPLDLKEAISSICFAAPRCSDLPELQQVQMLFAAKYGREFVAAAAELMPDCGVNRQMIELLSVRAPSVETKLKLLKEIAEEHEIEWDPADTETEFLKPHEDLLNGPIGVSTPSLPKELPSDPVIESHESPVSEADLDFLDLPEVPTAAVRTASDIPSAPDLLPHPSHFEPDIDSTPLSQDAPHIPSVQTEVPPHTPPPIVSVDPATELKQFVPFVSAPSPVSAVAADSSSVVETERSRYLSRSYSEADVDLQDVLAAAQAAAESAERAAASARAAASLAQVRISELITKRTDRKSDGGDGPKNIHHITRYEDWDSGSPNPMAVESPESKEQEHRLDRQPQRSVSLEDEPIFSYPNLFSSQKSDSEIR